MKKSTENYLERRPCRVKGLTWTADEEGIVTLAIENKGIMNRIAQKIFRKPKISYIHLDELGSFLWQRLDGTKTLIDLGKEVEEQFGEKAHPLYERLAKYVQILDSYHFVMWNE